MLLNAKYVAAALLGLSLCVIPVSASIITYSGADLGVLPSSPSGPNSTAAATSFNAAASLLGNVSVITFESAPVGTFSSSLAVAPGVMISGTNGNGGFQSINNTFDAAFPSLDGYNTTPGGANFVEMVGGTLTFHFATPVQFFGAFLSGVQDFTQDTFTFSDGTSETINVPETGTSTSVGELAFLGFTDAGASITSISINAGTSNTGFDALGVDDVAYQSAPAATPEPGSLVLLGSGLIGLAGALRRKLVAR